MTFFFQTNPIRVILKIILAIPSVIIAVGRCFCSTVQNTLNKARASIVKHASHRSGVWILASCSESMHFLKKNIHISNVINTFLSLPLSVVLGSRSGGWLRMFESRACLWDMIVSQVCLQEQSKQSFLTLAKENQSPLGLYRHPLTFFFTNPRFVLLIHDWRFFLFFFLRLSRITLRRHPTSSAGTASEVREKCLLRLKYGYFSYKNTWIRYRRPLFTLRIRVRHVLLWMCMLYLMCFGLLNKNTCPLQW